MKELKINQEKCSVDKRSLYLDFDLDGKNYRFSYNGWNEPYPQSFTMDGVPMNYGIITDYKYCIQAWCDTHESDRKVFIDRRYEHNYSYDVYFAGKHYLVGKEKE